MNRPKIEKQYDKTCILETVDILYLNAKGYSKIIRLNNYFGRRYFSETIGISLIYLATLQYVAYLSINIRRDMVLDIQS